VISFNISNMDACCPFLGKGKKPDLPPQLEPPNLGGVIFVLSSSYVVISGLCSFYLGATAMLMCCLVVLCLIMVAGEPTGRRYPSIGLLVIIGWASCGLAVFMGVTNYHTNFAPYSHAQAGRQYENVPADGRASAYGDAGTIKFQGSFLDDTRALGWKGHDYTYCVAPIVRSDSSVPGSMPLPQVQFWAIGRDCCSARGDFQCDGAANIDAAGGVVLHEAESGPLSFFFAPKSQRESYMAAVQAASALYEIDSANFPVLLRWVASPTGVLEFLFNWSVINFLVAAVVQLIIVSVLCTSIHLHFDGKIRRAVGAEVANSRNAGPGGSTANFGSNAGPVASSASTRPQRDPFLLAPQ